MVYLHQKVDIYIYIYDWFEERLETRKIADDDITSQYVPLHVNMYHCQSGKTLVWPSEIYLQ